MKTVDVYDKCPTCGELLTFATPSGAYLDCKNGHTFGRKVKCERQGCKRRATSFINRDNKLSAFCEAHDNWEYQ